MTDRDFEQQVRANLRQALDRELGPDPTWAESPAARRVAEVERRRRRRWPLRALAVAALIGVGGGAALLGGRLTPPPEPSPAPSLFADATTNPMESAAPSASPIPVAGPGGVWVPVGSMGTPRFGPDAVRLADGRVLVIGGSGGEFDAPTAELYDPATGTWSATGSMLHPREGLGPLLLLDGRVLVGDVAVEGSNGQPDVYGSELYDPETGRWSATGDMIGLADDPVVVLPDGRVLAGESLYDPATGTWSATGTRNHQGTAGGAATLLSDGTVLMAGGYGDWDGEEDPSFAWTDSAEIYDPATGAWTEIANMLEPTLPWMSALLPDGTALLVARYGASEMYDPASGTWSELGQPTGFGVARLLLSDGTVLMTDPDDTNPSPGLDCTAAALWDPLTDSLTAASSMLRCAEGTSFTLLVDGTVLVAGGRDCIEGNTVCVSDGSAALYVPPGVALPALPLFPGPLPPVFPDPTPVPTPLPPTAGLVPADARSWTVTVENRSSEDATLVVADDTMRLVGSAIPYVVPAGTTVDVTFLFPVDGGWIYVNPVPGEGGMLVSDDDIGIPGRIVVGPGGGAGWLSP